MKNYLLLLGCTLPLLLLAACTDAGKCTVGEVGCRCTKDQTCVSDAICKAGTCVPKSISGASGQTEVDSGPEKPIDCTVSSFNGMCKELCRAVCQNEDNLCIASSCDPGDCTDEGIAKEGGLLKACTEECGNDATCLQDLCEQELKKTCEDFWYIDVNRMKRPGPVVHLSTCFEDDPTCLIDPDYGCSDTCGTQSGVGAQLTENGVCEDGGDGSIMQAPCKRGTDCSDCGPRTCGKQLDKCDSGFDCCGYFSKTAYCVDIDRDPNLTDPRCLVTCETTNDCDAQFSCIATKSSASVCSP